MQIRSLLSLLSMTAVCAACGGGETPEPTTQSTTPTTATAPAKDDGVARPVTDGQLVVAHYASRDGMRGLVLDRTAGKFKVRVDGEKDIVELTPEEDRFAGELRGHFLVTPANKRMLYLSSRGSLKLFSGRDEIALTSDKPADALPAATVAGAPKKEKLAYQVLLEQLDAISVRKKLPQLTTNDSSNLAKVAEAFGQIETAMLVHFAARPKSSSPSIQWAPYGVNGVGFGGGSHQTDEAWSPTKKGLAKYGAIIKGYSHYESMGNHLFVQQMQGYPPPLANGTPGVVWEVDSVSVVFVTLDGGRYSVDCSYSTVENGAPLEKGAGPASGWPAPLQHSLVGITEVTALAKAGAVPQKTGDDLLAIDDEWNACAQKTWKKAKPEFDRLKTSDMNWSTRGGRQEALEEKWRETARRECKASGEKLEKALLSFIEDRNKERLGVLDKARARFGK